VKSETSCEDHQTQICTVRFAGSDCIASTGAMILFYVQSMLQILDTKTLNTRRLFENSFM